LPPLTEERADDLLARPEHALYARREPALGAETERTPESC
jgi:hypothetical protein